MQQGQPFKDTDFYKWVFNSFTLPVFVKNENLQYVAANMAFCDLIGHGPAEIEGCHDHDFLPASVCNSFWEHDLRLLQTGETVGKGEFSIMSGGQQKRFSTERTLLVSPGGQKHILGVLAEITESQESIDQLAGHELLIRNLVDDSPNLVLVHVNGKILYKNQTMTQLLCHPGGVFTTNDGLGLYAKTGRKTLRAALISLAEQAVIDHEDVELHFKQYDGPDKYYLLKNSFSSYKLEHAIMSVLVDITEQKNLEAFVLNKILETEDRDRKKFAIDLHDDLGPLLSGINIHLGLEQNLTDPVQYRENIRICKGLIREAFEKIRIIANNVTPGIIEMYGLDAAVRSFIQTLQIQSELSVHFHSGLAGRRFSNEIELHFLRIICELINNSIKHSGATKITIHLSCSVDCLVLLYWDNGKGYDAAEKLKNSAGMGISNLFYRVNVIGGQLDFLQKRGKMIVRIMKNFST